MTCTCGHGKAWHVEYKRNCRHENCDCLWYTSRASRAAGMPIRGLDRLLRKLLR